MSTLTLDKSTRALAVLAWRRGMTKKRFYNLAEVHNASKQIRVEIRRASHSGHMTQKQAMSLKRR